MSEKQKQILELIKKEITLDDLSSEINLSHKQTYQRILKLGDQGYNVLRKYFETGQIQFGLSSEVQKAESSEIIYTAPGSTELRVIVDSDYHLGNDKQRLDAIHALYNYCINNDIHTILNCGDFLNGMIESKVGKLLENDYETQLEMAIKNHPYDPHILTYFVLGNHDRVYLLDNNLNLVNAIKRKRFDLIPLSYQNSFVKIKGDEIRLYHPSDATKPSFGKKITFRGHSHISKFVNAPNANSSYIYVPTYSDMFYENEHAFPSMYDVVFYFHNNGSIKRIDVSTYIYCDKKFIKTGEYTNQFLPTHNDFNYEEKPKVLKKQIPNNISQIEKFYARYRKNNR